MTYRMKELERITGTPRTTIHYYTREGLLAAPEKTAPNAALYTEEHRARIGLIRRLRSGPYPAPLTVVRRALELIDKGVDPETVTSLERAVVGSQAVAAGEPLTEAALAKRAGVSKAFVRSLVEARVLLPLPDTEPPYDGLDSVVVRRVAELCETRGMTPARLTEIARLLRRVVELEMELRDELVREMTVNEAAAVSRAGQLFVSAWHAYLLSRSRMHEIRRRGLGVDEGPADTGGTRHEP